MTFTGLERGTLAPLVALERRGVAVGERPQPDEPGPTLRGMRHIYLRHVNELGAQWNDHSPVHALTAFASATGLRSLHGAHE